MIVIALREAGTGNREQGTENREQGTGNSKWVLGFRNVLTQKRTAIVNIFLWDRHFVYPFSVVIRVMAIQSPVERRSNRNFRAFSYLRIIMIIILKYLLTITIRRHWKIALNAIN
jgi:hypothetical protein